VLLKFGVPPPQQFEAPSSWLSRLALAQGCELFELLEFLGLDTAADVDRQLHGSALVELRQRCSLRDEDFRIAGQLMANLHRAGRLIDAALLRNLMRRPRFRYCPGCLKERRIAYLDIHWRFSDWRYCPAHNCLMEEACWRCRSSLLYPADMPSSVAGRAGYGTQARCLACTADLTAVVPCSVDPALPTSLAKHEACWLLNGRALLAALYSGGGSCGEEAFDIIEIGRRAYIEWLPQPSAWKESERRIRLRSVPRP
jgi:hypothetical protein